MTATDLGGGARSREADGARIKRGVMPASDPGVLRPVASSVRRCRWCDRPSSGPSDPRHKPCVAAEQRMDRDLAARRQPAHDYLGRFPW